VNGEEKIVMPLSCRSGLAVTDDIECALHCCWIDQKPGATMPSVDRAVVDSEAKPRFAHGEGQKEPPAHWFPKCWFAWLCVGICVEDPEHHSSLLKPKNGEGP
jgi:hypothetical protein